jgi:regulator of replication initiation timing
MTLADRLEIGALRAEKADLRKQVEALKAEVARLRDENTRLREALAVVVARDGRGVSDD